MIRFALEKSILRSKNLEKGSSRGQASLHLADDTATTNEESVQQQHRGASYRYSPVYAPETIPLADQSGLHSYHASDETGLCRVRKELAEHPPKKSIDANRRRVCRPFKENLDHRYEEYSNRCDREQQYPENNRGIKNPYKVGTGKSSRSFR
ncbi:MAG: hypothetical protein U5K72_15955 [Balneolaceae bacterium]|nr:hypothetical protein [Balneolaceae bacterium]